MAKREDVTSKVWRKTVTDAFIQTLYGGKTIKLQWCKSCRQYKPRVEFYVESSSKSNGYEKLRNQCIPCWDKKFGKHFVPESGSATLFDFLK